MPLTNAEKQKRTRRRKADKLARYATGLRDVIAEAKGKRGDLAMSVSAIAWHALHGELHEQLKQSLGTHHD